MSQSEFEDRIARIEMQRDYQRNEEPTHHAEFRESKLVTLILWTLFLALAWGAIAHPWITLLIVAIVAPISAMIWVPVLWFRRGKPRSPERRAILDLLDYLNPFS